MRIIIQSIPHKDQRYPTCGDWYQDASGWWRIQVSELGDWRFEALVAFHELVEMLLCQADGVDAAEVDRFDLAFEDDTEPGDDLSAPYYEQHQRACGYERLLAADLDVDWLEYERTIEAL